MKITRKNDLSLRLLEIFGAVIVNQTTVQAAEDLGISQPTVSIAIKQLEEQLGFNLFERRNRRLQPTQEAHTLFADIEPIFSNLRSLETRVSDLRAGRAGKLRVMATPPLGHSVVPQALRNFLASREDVAVQYDVRRLETVVSEVELGNVDVGLVLALEAHPAIDVTILQSDEMIALIPKGHDLSDAAVISPMDCVRYGHIGLERSSRLGLILRQAFEKVGAPYTPRVEVRYCHTAAVLANARIGVAIVDRYTPALISNMDLEIRKFEQPIKIPACLLTRKDFPLSLLAKEFIKEIKSAIASMG
jgi:DNA-binding transcriptional LysR family regulator